jgi:hypothetical protein
LARFVLVHIGGQDDRYSPKCVEQEFSEVRMQHPA